MKYHQHGLSWRVWEHGSEYAELLMRPEYAKERWIRKFEQLL